MLASRLRNAGKANGWYFALPTMATANIMYKRMAKSYRALFDYDATPRLRSPMAKGLHDGFTASIA